MRGNDSLTERERELTLTHSLTQSQRQRAAEPSHPSLTCPPATCSPAMPRDDVKKSSKASKAKGEKTKRSPSAYIIFASEMRPTVKAENPDATFGELGKLLGAKWAALSDAEKAVASFAFNSNGFLISNAALPEEGRGRKSLIGVYIRIHLPQAPFANYFEVASHPLLFARSHRRRQNSLR